MAHHQQPGQYLQGVFAQQHFIAGDIGLALGAVEDQGVHRVAAGIELDRRREARAAKADDAGVADNPTQFLRAQFGKIEHIAFARPPAFLTVGLDDDAGSGHAGCMGYRVVGDGEYGTRAGSMEGGADGVTGACDELSLEHLVAHRYHRLGGGTDMLLEWQNQPWRQLCRLHGHGRGVFLVLLEHHPALELKQTVHQWAPAGCGFGVLSSGCS